MEGIVVETAPPPRKLPAFALWLTIRGIDFRTAGERLACSHETVRLVCLPFDDGDRRVPGKALMERIWRWTSGEVRPRDFYPYDQDVAA